MATKMEFVFFFFVIPGKIRKVAKPRGESTVKWVMLSWIVWIGLECFAVVVVLVAIGVLRYLLSWPDEGLATIMIVIGYLVGMAGGIIASDRIRQHVARRPISTQALR